MEVGTTTDLAQFDRIRADIRVFAEPCLKTQVTDRDSSEAAMDMVKQAASFRKRIEERRTEIVRPINAQAAKVNDYAKTILSEIEPAEKHLRAQLGQYELQQRKLREEEHARLQAERVAREADARAKAEAEKAAAPAFKSLFKSKNDVAREKVVAEVVVDREIAQINEDAAAAAKAVDAGRVKGSRSVWKFEVTDSSKVPRELCVVDEKAIRAAVNGGAREIPGVRIYEDVQITVR